MPHISYAGVPLLLEDPGYEFQVWLERNLSLLDLTLFGIEPPDIYQGRNRPRGPFLGGTFEVTDEDTVELPSTPFVGLPLPNYSTRRPPRWKINTLWWPTGATRWSIGLFLVDEASLDRIIGRLASNGAATFVAREVAGGVPGVFLRTNLHMLPPRVLNNTETGVNGHLICLVDERFYWQFLDTGLLEVNTSTTWEEVYDHIGTSMGVTIDYDDINDGYFRPNPVELTRRYENAALLLDAVAHSVGQRIVYKTDNTVQAQNPTTAANQQAINQRNLLLRGLSAGGEQTKYRRTLYPAAVRVVFPAKKLDEFLPDGNVFPVTITKGTVAFDNYGSIAGTVKVVHTTAPAHFDDATSEADIGAGTATPLNAAEVQQLAEQIARDEYAWKNKQYDETGLGLVPWEPTGFDDYADWHFGYQTRIPYAWGLGEEGARV